MRQAAKLTKTSSRASEQWLRYSCYEMHSKSAEEFAWLHFCSANFVSLRLNRKERDYGTFVCSI